MAEYMLKRYHRRRSEWITKLGGSCVDCGSLNNLNFDHVIAKEKEYDIAKILSAGSELKVSNEMAKCVLRCEVCHKAKSARMRDIRIVNHGEGLTGKKNCLCKLCRPLKNEYARQFKRNKKQHSSTCNSEAE